MTVQQRRTQSERREESEQRLLKAAAEIIATEGFAAASFERIGRAAGYSRGLASQKFGSKDGLVEAVINFVMERIDAETDRAIGRTTDPVEQVLAYIETVLTAIERDHVARSYFVMMAAAIANRLPIQKAFLAQHNNVRVRVSSIIERGIAEHTISPKINADGAAISVGSMMLGIASQLLLDPNLDIIAVRSAAMMAVRRALEAGSGNRNAAPAAASAPIG